MATPFMNLVLPVPTVTPGPLYASQEVTAFTAIDSHDHTLSQGVQVPVNGLNINADFPFNNFNATTARSYRMTTQAAPLSLGTDLNSIYSANGDLYYNNGIGQQVQITQGNALDATSIGGIGGDYATSPASVFYTFIQARFTFWQDNNQSANIDVGPVTIRKLTVGSAGITISPSASLSTSYGITLPAAAPLSTKLLAMDSTGNLLPIYDVDNVYISFDGSNNITIAPGVLTGDRLTNNTVTFSKLQQVAGFTVPGNPTTGTANLSSITSASNGDVLRRLGGVLAFGQITNTNIAPLEVKTGNIDNLAVTTAKIDNLAVTTAKIDNLAVTTAKIDNSAVDFTKVATNIVLPGSCGTDQNFTIAAAAGASAWSILQSTPGGLKLDGGGSGMVFPNGFAGAGVYSGNTPGNLGIVWTAASPTTKTIVTSSVLTSAGLNIIRGRVDSGGNTVGGEGFTSVYNGANTYTVTYDTPNVFADIGVVSVTGADTTQFLRWVIIAASTTAFTVTFDALPANGFHFMVIGIRST